MDSTEQLGLGWRDTVTDEELSTLHALAFGRPVEVEPWTERLERYSLGWVTARRETQLVGFCNIITDGRRHAFLLDTAVHPEHQGTGIGRSLVLRGIAECRKSPAEWLHVDFEIDLGPLYLTEGLFRPTTAGLLRL